LIGVPAGGWSQTPSPATSQPPAAQQSADAKGGSPAEHIRQAEAALNDIPSSTLPARAKSRVAELKRHLHALEKSAAASPAPGASAANPSSKAKNTWANDAAAIDKILNELLGSTGGGATGAPPATAGTTGTTSKSAPLTLDDSTKAKLMEVRQHVTAFAASMSGAGSSAAAPPSEPSSEPAAAAAAQAPAATPAPTAESTPPASASAPSAQSAPSPAQSAEESQAQAPTAQGASSQVDEDAAKRHLTAARDSLAQLTQMPAAAQLTGETRTHVSQLISNFNELITAKTDWKAAYDKVTANLTALIGADSAPPEAAAAPSGTPGAVGTSGNASATLDPGIKGKLVEFRTHLMAFEKSAGTASSGAPDSPAASSAPAASPSAGAPASPSPGSSPSSKPASSSASPSSPSPDPDPAPGSNPAAQSSAQSSSAGQMSQGNPISHIEAIEALMIGSGSKLTLEPAQVEQIRMHLAELRKAIEKK
jgi:hypothetical protein